MKKTNGQKGITLIALIITIVILLILAVVAINSIKNQGILLHATNTTNTYDQAIKNEQGMLDEYEGFLDNGGKFYAEYKLGDEVTIGNETFYVIKDSSKTDSKVILLTKYCIDTTNLIQSSEASKITFSETNYWESITDITYSYDLIEEVEPDESHYAAKAAYDYGLKVGGEGRLMIVSEADVLSKNTSFSSKLFEQEFWLGSARYSTHIHFSSTRFAVLL